MKNLKILGVQIYYCKEGIEVRQLVFRSADIYCQIVNNLFLCNIVILY